MSEFNDDDGNSLPISLKELETKEKVPKYPKPCKFLGNCIIKDCKNFFNNNIEYQNHLKQIKSEEMTQVQKKQADVRTMLKHFVDGWVNEFKSNPDAIISFHITDLFNAEEDRTFIHGLIENGKEARITERDNILKEIETTTTALKKII